MCTWKGKLWACLGAHYNSELGSTLSTPELNKQHVWNLSPHKGKIPLSVPAQSDLERVSSLKPKPVLNIQAASSINKNTGNILLKLKSTAACHKINWPGAENNYLNKLQ